MAYGPGKSGGPAYQIGVDVMKVTLPQHQPFARFVGGVDSQAKSFFLLFAAMPSNSWMIYPLRTDDRPGITHIV
jgi:hypothetical protein